jgi:type II secretory pathway pseudopilin PulG
MSRRGEGGLVHRSAERGGGSAEREGGFSLVEVLVATGVLVAGIAAVLQLFVIAMQATLDARDATYAAVLAAQKLEELRAAPFPPPDEATEYLNARGALLPDRAEAVYERRWIVAPFPAQPSDTVVLAVRVWRRGVMHRAVRLTTVRTRRGG